jgi:hypothetical protein
MATNKLFEAAAEILAAGKGKNAMPSQKLDGEVQVAGGPTPENAKPDDNSHKMTFTSKSATAPTTKSSDASAKMEETEVENEEIVSEEEQIDEKMEWKKKMKEDVDALFADDATISEEFKTKVSTIFEARVQDRVAQIEEEIEGQYASMLEEAVESLKEDLTNKVNDYLGYVVEEWMEENEIAIEKGIRTEITEDFINGLRNLFAEHYIDVPAEKVDLVDELASKVDELETKLDEEVERGVEYRSALIEAFKEVVTHEVCEGLTATQVEKIKSLAESVDFSTEEEYRTKLETIRENYFPSGVKKADENQLNEQVEDGQKAVVTDSFMNSIVQSISKTTRI